MQKVMHMLQNKKKGNFVVWLQIHNITAFVVIVQFFFFYKNPGVKGSAKLVCFPLPLTPVAHKL